MAPALIGGRDLAIGITRTILLFLTSALTVVKLVLDSAADEIRATTAVALGVEDPPSRKQAREA